MENQLAYCSACDKQVHIVVSPQPLHGGQANLEDGAEIVCLDFGQRCTGQSCPMSGLPSLAMGVRLARTELRGKGWKKIRALCAGCEQVTEMQLLDRTHAFCTVCKTTNTCALLTASADDYVITLNANGKGASAEA
jgi:hypothetical protein